jgi:hypothetical protein
MKSFGDVSVIYEKVCDSNGFCLVRLVPIQQVTMVASYDEDTVQSPEKQERTIEESINYIDEVLQGLEK